MDKIRKYEDSLEYGNRLLPSTKEEHVGIEVECLTKVPREVIIWQMIDKGLENVLDVGGDGSIREEKDTAAIEFRLLSSVKDLRKNLQTFQKLLNESGTKVNKSCGLHIHLDARNKDADQMFNSLVASQNLLAKCVAPYRCTGSYSSLYTGINGFPDPQYTKDACISKSNISTVEVRLMEGTTDMERVYNWIMLCRHIAHRKIGTSYFTASAKEIIERIKPSKAAAVILKSKKLL